ncbi:dUTP diphosphatase [Halobacillus karajensis]|uniref:dUTP diphosphatase n=1 Tax=Halobacillus karajensis TaxID=195088 RepID=UPI00045D0BB4|nr:dUTP diphosphatase [Halobacillus karajensis]CDQ17966.1 dUTPase [Halobacillus karajensis]
MNLEKLFEIQGGLDYHITKEKQLGEEDLTSNKILAFKVELGELLNEIPESFKFWSNRKDSKREDIREEFVDGMHFLLSVAIERKYHTYVTNASLIVEEGNVIDFCNRTFESSINSSGEWLRVFETYLSLGVSLGFTLEEMEQAYYDKNEINHRRQINGY